MREARIAYGRHMIKTRLSFAFLFVVTCRLSIIATPIFFSSFSPFTVHGQGHDGLQLYSMALGVLGTGWVMGKRYGIDLGYRSLSICYQWSSPCGRCQVDAVPVHL